MISLTEQQEKNYLFFKNNLGKLLKDDLHKHKYAVIMGEKIHKYFDTLDNAVVYAVDHLKKGDYIIQQIIDENEVINFVKAAIV
jgi:hypothetical protein